MTEQAQLPAKNESEFANSLGGFANILGMTNPNPYSAQLSQTDTMMYNNRWYLVSNLRQLLSELYVEHGIVQTLVDQPVDDAYRSGFEIKSGQLSGEDVETLEVFLERNRVIASLLQAIKWARLFGGGAVLIITDQDPSTPLNLKAITKDTPIEFRAVDMWELYYAFLNIPDAQLDEENAPLDNPNMKEYQYYGIKIHPSRVYRIEGKQAPSFIRPRLRGWGMSELERLVRSFNQYLKNQDVIFELLDEAKVDVYKIQNLNASLIDDLSTQKIGKRVQYANTLKNYLNALVMDKEDEYDQKTMQFAGLSDMLVQIRQGLAADLKMPVTKLFGISAAGFNSGEDDIENYNSMLESEIRSKTKFQVVDLLTICCQKVFGFMPDDLQITFKPLRIMSAKEMEEVKERQFNRVMRSYESGLVGAEEAKNALNKDSLLPIEVDPSLDAAPPIKGTFVSDGDETDAA